MAHPTQDITQQELSKIAWRMAGQVSERLAMPWFALQYRLSEVGQQRTDTRLLARAAKELLNRPESVDSTEQVSEPVPGIFLRPGIVEGDREAIARRVSDQLEEIHAETVISLPPDSFLPQGINIEHVTETVSTEGESTGYKRVVLNTTADFEAAGDKWSLWLLNDLKWIYPDDPRLFAHLHYCARHHLRPIVLARKIAPPTFVLFKHAGVFGVEYYSHVVRDGALDRLRVLIEDLGWLHTITVRALRGHAFRTRVDAALRTTPINWERAERVLQASPPKKLLKAKDNSPRALLEWLASDGAALGMPERWKETVARWAVLEARRRTPVIKAQPGVAQENTAEVDSRQTGPNKNPDSKPSIFGREFEKSRIPIRLQ